MRSLDIAKRKTLRGAIVTLLFENYGSRVAIGTARQILRRGEYMEDDDVKQAFLYLSDELTQYVRIKFSDDGEYWTAEAELTARGVNLAEGDIKDEGVVIE